MIQQRIVMEMEKLPIELKAHAKLYGFVWKLVIIVSSVLYVIA